MPAVRRTVKYRSTASCRKSQQHHNKSMEVDMGFEQLAEHLRGIDFHKEEPMDIETFSEEPARKHGDTDRDEGMQTQKTIKGQPESRKGAGLLETGAFYPDKLFFKNVPRNATKELLVNYLENITGQHQIELQFCDEPGDALATFKAEIDFETAKHRCEAKPLKKEHLKVYMVPVSSSILVENHSPSTDVEDLYNYFQTPRANAGAVIEVKPVEYVDKFIVVFASTKATDGVLKVTHRLGGRELRVSLYLECLGPSGGRTEPYVFVPPPPVEVTEADNLKVCFLRHSADMLNCFNDRLSQVHAHATIVGNVLNVNCTVTESMHKVYLLVEKWKENVDKQLDICFDFIRLERIQVLAEIWLEVKKAVNESKLNYNDLVLMLADDCSLVVLGRSDTKGDAFEDIQNIVRIKQEQFDLQKLEVSETKKLKTHQLDLLRLSSFLSDTRTLHKGLKIHLQEGLVAFRGPLMAIREAQVNMYEVIHAASSTVVRNMPDIHTCLLNTDQSRVAVRKRLKKAGVDATWEYHDEGVIIVYSFQKTSLPKAVGLIQTSFKSEHITLNKVSVWEWKDTEEKLVRENRGLVVISTDASTDVHSENCTDGRVIISITAFCDIMPAIKEHITKFASERTIYSAVFQLSSSRMKFVSLFWEEQLSIITRLFTKREKVHVTRKNIQVEGTKKEIDLVRKKLAKLAEQIVCTEEVITRKETIRFVSDLFNNKELEAIACTSKCVLSLHPENTDVQMVSTNQPAECPWVHAVQEDITLLPVDAIVNAANERMDHAGGLARHIVLKGGHKIQAECYNILKARGKLSEGDVLVSGPGKLPCKSIIHAVGPRYKGGNKGEEECLRATVMKCLQTASNLGYSSIAIPAISSGIFGYPVKEATHVIVQAVKLFFQTNCDSSIKDVQLADILANTIRDFEKALQVAYDKTALLALQSVAIERELTKTGVIVSAVEGDITELSVDAVVNAANENMSHDGGLAGYIVKKGGDDIQKEYYRILTTRGSLSEGDVLVSGPGKLPCKSIIHAVGPRYKGGNQGEKECLHAVVVTCLQTASELGYTSIALPAISSGVFGYPVEEATRVIVEAVLVFFEKNPLSSIKDVRLCDNITKTAQEFEKAIKVTSPRRLHLASQASEAASSAKELASCQAVHRSQSSGRQRVTAIEGDITQFKVDAIVNTADGTMHHFAGLAGQIVKKGGEEIQKECYSLLTSRGSLSTGDVLVSGPGKLPCKSIIHAVVPRYLKGDKQEKECLRATVLKCLETASDLGYTSIAVPAISSGGLCYPVEEATRVIVQAVKCYFKTNSDSSITDVNLCDIVASTVESFKRALNEVEESESLDDEKQGVHDIGRRNTVLNFGGIKLAIKQGDITEEVVDAVVNSSNSQLDLNKGTISRLLKTKCGPSLESECQTKLSEMTHRKLVTTGAYNLRCKHILHIDTAHYAHSDRMKTAFENILQEAEHLALNSVALPAIGTGVLNLSPSKSARAMGRALVTHSRIRKAVTSVTVVLHDAAMLEDFTRTLTITAAAQDNSQTTSSETHDVLERLYLTVTEEIEDVTTNPITGSVPEVLKLYIFAANQDKRDDFLKALEDLVDSKIVEQEVKDFDKVPSGKLVKMCERHNLELQQRDTGATVRGMPDDVHVLKEEISSIIKKAERKQQENMIANLVQWYYFEATATGSKRIPYEKRENLMIEDAYQVNQDAVELADSRGTIYIISFKDMTDTARLNPANSVQIIRKEVIADWANSNSLLPEIWEPQGAEQFVKRVTLVKGCPEYRTVKSTMSRTTSSAFRIKSIERLQNPELYKQYLAKKTQMDKQNNGMDSEKTLWHGTSSDAIDNINLYGFNRSFCGKNATVYGQGVYFAVNASYSMSDTYSVRDQSGRKYMYQCKVLVGYSTVGDYSMKVLPKRHGNIRYDSATDNTSHPSMYIIFSDIQAYPEYLITFQ